MTDSIDPLQPLSDALERQRLLKLALQVGNQLSDAIQGQLDKDGSTNLRIQCPREYFTDRVIQQVQHGLYYLLKDCISGLDTRAKDKKEGDIEFYEGADEVHSSLWKRKYIEFLVETKLFCQTNEPAYYHHLSLLYEYIRISNLQKDESFFYGSNSKRWDLALADIDAKIVIQEQLVDINKCWYLRSPRRWEERTLKEKRGNSVLKALRQKYIDAHALLGASAHLITGLTYDVGYGQYSKDIHADPYDTDLRNRNSPTNFDASLNVLALFALYIYDNVANLLNLGESKKVAQMKRILEKNQEKDRVRLDNFTVKPEIKINDFVLVGSQLAQVRTIKESQFGYRTFGVIFLSEPPLDGIVFDEIPAPYLRLFLKHSDIKASVKDELSRLPAFDIDGDVIDNYIGKSAIKIYSRLGGKLEEFLSGRVSITRSDFK